MIQLHILAAHELLRLHSQVAGDLIREVLEGQEDVLVRSLIWVVVAILCLVLFLVELILTHQLLDIMLDNLDLLDDVLLLQRVGANFILDFPIVR